MWDELYQRHYGELLSWCRNACRDSGLAEDLVQETFVRAVQNTHLFMDMGGSQRRAWLFRTLKNLLFDHNRREALEQRYAQFLSDDGVPEWGYQETEGRLLLARLPTEDQMLFCLRYLEGYNASELSEMLNLPAGTIRARLSRCRKRLKEMLLED